MFNEVMESYKLMSKTDKREKLINELKVMVAVFENMCNERNISYRQIQSKEILDLKNGNESEEDFLEAALVYIEYLKEVLGSLFTD